MNSLSFRAGKALLPLPAPLQLMEVLLSDFGLPSLLSQPFLKEPFLRQNLEFIYICTDVSPQCAREVYF